MKLYLQFLLRQKITADCGCKFFDKFQTTKENNYYCATFKTVIYTVTLNSNFSELLTKKTLVDFKLKLYS